MTNSIFQYEFKELKISVSHVGDLLGYKEGDDRELVEELLENIFKESADICTIKAEYRIYSGVEFNRKDWSINIDKINFQIKKIVFGQIKNSESIAVFLSTAGEEIGIRSRKAMQESDLLRGYLYDVVGSEIVEAAADLMQSELKNAMVSAGKKITNRYSPGYCGWDVAEQHKLFQLVPYNFCGIRLTESALMDPVKSVSGIIGIGENIKYNPYTCNLCDMRDCVYRKVRERKA